MSSQNKVTIYSCRFYPLPEEYCERTLQIYKRLERLAPHEIVSLPYIIKWLGVYWSEPIYNPRVKDGLKITKYCERILSFYNELMFDCYNKKQVFKNIGIDTKGSC